MNSNAQATSDSVAQPDPRPKTTLQRLRLPLMLLAPVVVIAGGIYLYITGGRYESTDDAYVQAATVPISSNVSGRVVDVLVHDNQRVARGDTLFRLDETPYRIALADANARLADARLRIASLKSTYRQRLTEYTAARDTQNYAQREFDRQSGLLASGVSSQAQVDQAKHALDTARQQVASVAQQIGVAEADLGGNPDIRPEEHPLVQQAQAALAKAQLDLSYAVIHAPSDGIVAKVEQLQVGSYITASAPVFLLVSTHDVWVEANFKEDQLARMAPGQGATVKIDRYPGRSFKAQVASLSPSTGSQFSLLPPENATGNWVKVVQRVPVRLQFADADPNFAMQAGLSVSVTVDTRSEAKDRRSASAASSGGAASP